MGPLQFMVVGFEGSRFTGEIMPELNTLRDQKVIRVIDLVFINKSSDGSIESHELSDLSPTQVDALTLVDDDDAGAWFAQDDIDEIARSLPDESSVALVLIEHVWAKRLHESIRRANGELLAEGMVPQPVVNEVEALLRT